MTKKALAEGLEQFGKWAAALSPLFQMAARYAAMICGAKLPEWAPAEFKDAAWWFGIILMVFGAAWGGIRSVALYVWPRIKAILNKDGTKPPSNGLLGGTLTKMTLIGIAAATLVGCASPYDGVRRGPFLHHSVNKAYRLAEEAGCQTVRLGGSSVMWVFRQQLKAAGVPEFRANMTANEFTQYDQQVRAIAMAAGKTCEQIVSAYNPGGRNWAIFGEASLWTSIVGGLTAAIAKLSENNDDDGGGGSAAPDAAPGAGGGIVADTVIINTINGNNNQSSQNTGEGGRGR